MMKSWMLQLITIILGLIPAVILVLGAFYDFLGPDPVEVLLHQTGLFGLYGLLLTLSITPLKRIFKWNFLHPLRRILGLLAFSYILGHFIVYVVFERFGDIAEVLYDIVARPYITIGFIALLGLMPLVVTSTKWMMRKLKHKWVQLHRLNYIITILAIIHFILATKADMLEPVIYATILVFLLSIRIGFWIRKRYKPVNATY